MEKDFDGFINYVYEIKKNKEVGKPNEISDIDIYQWKKSLQEKEQERLRLLEEALNGIENKEKYMVGSQLLSNGKDQIYQASMPYPNMTNLLNKNGDPKPQISAPPPQEIPLGSNKLDDALKEYDKFKPKVETAMNNQNKIRDDPSLSDPYYKKPVPEEMPQLRDPRIRDLYDEDQKLSQDPSEEHKQFAPIPENSPAVIQNNPPIMQNSPPRDNNPRGLGMRDVYDKYNKQRPANFPQEEEKVPVNNMRMPENNEIPVEMPNNPERSPRMSDHRNNPPNQLPGNFDPFSQNPNPSENPEPSQGRRGSQSGKKKKGKKKKKDKKKKNNNGDDENPEANKSKG